MGEWLIVVKHFECLKQVEKVQYKSDHLSLQDVGEKLMRQRMDKNLLTSQKLIESYLNPLLYSKHWHLQANYYTNANEIVRLQ